MSKRSKCHKKDKVTKKHVSGGGDINLNITFKFNISDNEIQIEQRAEGGGQINKDVGINANQGGQNALDHSNTRNDQSNFADGNGRSGIAGNENDEAGGQQGIKVRDSILNKSKIESSSEHDESIDPSDGDVEESR
ncbi:MAG TPA: hypothetical protein VNS08_00525 [Ureibacillus sp.]|nr:hypothetical protein [Ureibacillus sp.]